MKHLITFCMCIISFIAFGQIKNINMKKQKPKNLTECIQMLDKNLKKQDKEYIKTLTEDELYDQGVEEDKIDDYLDEYAQKKEDIISKWFQQRWKNALKNAHIQADSYFSPHDSYFYTDLNTGKQINEDQIKEKHSQG